uniref:Uncharacterized protein n=1 Tax=Tetranychus urticae TaxID=32264 RepID=T1K9I3_TETUR
MMEAQEDAVNKAIQLGIMAIIMIIAS